MPAIVQPLDVRIGLGHELAELLLRLSESDLDSTSKQPPTGHDEMFGTYRRCLQFVSDHWYMHRGQLADARRAARIDRMWF